MIAFMSQGSQDNTERPYLEWLHHAGFSEALQDQLEAEDQDACVPLKVSFAKCCIWTYHIGRHWHHSMCFITCVEASCQARCR